MFAILLPFLFLSLAGLKISSAADSECDAQCRGKLSSSWEIEQHASTDSSFYTVPSDFSSDLPAGSLLHVEEATDLSNYAVPSGLTMSRIIYTTSDLNGTILPASAYIIWPYTPAEALNPGNRGNGYPMVAWGHGTSGAQPLCSPSNYRNLQYHFMAPFLLALQGMAVVAPDYAGLGVDKLPSGEHFGHLWGAAPAQANDLANAIIAARAAFPNYLKPDGPFVAMGHSQGGGAAWAFAERLVDKPIKGYKGTVAFAPPANLIVNAEQAIMNPSEPWASTILGSQPRLIDAVTVAFPSYNYSGMSMEAYDRWSNIIQPLSGCLPTETLVFSDMAWEDLAQPDWTKDETVQTYSKMIDTGRKKFKGPLLVLAAEKDTVVPLDSIVSVVDDTCQLSKREHWGESIEMVTYAGMNHFSVIQASQIKWLAWVKERLSSSPSHAKPGCVKSAMEGFRTQYTPDVGFPNFLQGWASPDEFWKYLL
ncbi:hypothetical protein FQN55_004756 [Onygenales sp. PD_40]|nr:hypothetical protein FQN55_004756 [Onygenales sp. PD_40]